MGWFTVLSKVTPEGTPNDVFFRCVQELMSLVREWGTLQTLVLNTRSPTLETLTTEQLYFPYSQTPDFNNPIKMCVSSIKGLQLPPSVLWCENQMNLYTHTAMEKLKWGRCFSYWAATLFASTRILKINLASWIFYLAICLIQDQVLFALRYIYHFTF